MAKPSISRQTEFLTQLHHPSVVVYLSNGPVRRREKPDTGLMLPLGLGYLDARLQEATTPCLRPGDGDRVLHPMQAPTPPSGVPAVPRHRPERARRTRHPSRSIYYGHRSWIAARPRYHRALHADVVAGSLPNHHAKGPRTIGPDRSHRSL